MNCDIKRCKRLAAVCYLLPVMLSSCAEAAKAVDPKGGLRVDVLDTVALPESAIDGLKVSELSGLSFDASKGWLYAVSDKSRLFRFAFSQQAGRIVRLEPVAGFDLTDEDRSRLRDSGFNAEGIALIEGPRDSEFIVVSENGPRISRFSARGRWLEDISIPEPLRGQKNQRSANDGLESITFDKLYGVITAPEEPLLSYRRTSHSLFGVNGTMFSYDTSDVGKTGIKALESLGNGAILILERRRSSGKSEFAPLLRLLDISSCLAVSTCPTQFASVRVPGVRDADFEGITGVGGELFLMVSDDLIDGARRALFVLLRISKGSQPQN